MATNWHRIWLEAIGVNSLLIRNGNEGERRFAELIQKHGEDGMIFYEWALAYETIGEKSLALEKFKIAKEKLPLEHWKEKAQYGIEKINGKFTKAYPRFLKPMHELHSYLYSPIEQEIKYLLISSLPNVETETASTLIYFRMSLEFFIEIIAKKTDLELYRDLKDNINLVCDNFSLSKDLHNSMDNIRHAGNAKVHPYHSDYDEELAEDIYARINDFLKIVKFYKSESEVSKLCHK